MTPKEKALETPAMQQYMAFKKQYKDAILFFRMGDFYEMFFEDAVEASEILGITLTSRHKDADIPLAGVPWHSADQYIKKLLEAGKKIAICEQFDVPNQKKRTIERNIVRILTPGTIVEESSLVESKSNWLMSIFLNKNEAFLCWIDVSCGDVFYTRSQETALFETVSMVSPREIVLSEPSSLVSGEVLDRSEQEDWVPSQNAAEYLESEAVLALEHGLVESIRQMLFYIDSLYFGNFPPLRAPIEWKDSDTASLDYNTVANLEIEKTLIGGERVGSLLWAIDRTQTPMGKRLLAEVIKKPLKSREKILCRQECVSFLTKNTLLLDELRREISHIRDFERTLSRILVKRGTPREIAALADSLDFALKLHSKILEMNENMPFFQGDNELSLTQATVKSWSSRFVDEPPFNYKEGGFVVSGFRQDLFELSDLVNNSRGHIVALETKERERTQIPALKIGYNRVTGYYIEISKRFEDKVPPEYIRKQTTIGAERYFTSELKQLEEDLLTAKERMTSLELQILEETVCEIERYKAEIQRLAKFISWLDVFCGFAKLARDNRYCCPEISDDDMISIVDGRHPVIEAAVSREKYVPASVEVGERTKRFCLITGPNMGGKSTIMRMTALIVLLAQTGSFVPAQKAKIGIVDSIFTRVGASDNLSKGESTFLVEMKETAAILNSATKKSLIILDEIGRGTGTYDGISLAKAIAEFIITKINAITLFATHYHILTELSEDFPSVCNFHMSTKEYAGRIKFLYQLAEGGSSRSFGVEVAKMTTMPREVIKNAEATLREMEKADRKMRFEKGSTMQSDIFSVFTDNTPSEPDHLYEIERILNQNDPEKLTPREAMNILFQIYDILKKQQ